MTDTVVSPKAPLTAEERRQRRMQKILENSESRMNRILSNGEDGNGKRLAPAMEGGEGYSFPDDSSTLVENNRNYGSFAPKPDRRRDPSELLSAQAQKNKSFIDVTLFAIFLGVLSRFFMLLTGPINIGILWTILYTTIVMRFSTAGLGDKEKSDINVIIGALSQDTFFKKIINAGFYFMEFIQTTITFVATFLLTHMLFEIYDLSTDYKLVF